MNPAPVEAVKNIKNAVVTKAFSIKIKRIFYLFRSLKSLVPPGTTCPYSRCKLKGWMDTFYGLGCVKKWIEHPEKYRPQIH